MSFLLSRTRALFRAAPCIAKSASIGLALSFAAACGSSHGTVVNEQKDATIALQNGVGKVPLTGCVAFDYMAPFNVGGQLMNLLVDSGSASFGVAGEQCANCTVANGVHNRYSLSSTGRKTGFSSSSQYLDGSKWTGTIINDSIAVGTEATLATPAVPVNFADILSESSFFEAVTCAAEDDTAFDGIAGLGTDEQLTAHTTSFLTSLASTKQMAADIFSLQLCDVGGWMWMGGIDPSSMTAAPQYTPLVQTENAGYFVGISDMALGGTSLRVDASSLGPAVVDSGTNLILLTSSGFTAFEQEMEANAAYKAIFSSGFISGQQSCTTAKGNLTRAQVDAQMPRFTITFPNESGGTFSIDLPATSSYLMAMSGGVAGNNVYYCPAITGYSDDTLSIIGNAAMRSHIVVFDRSNGGRIGFAPQTGCKQSNIYPTSGT